MRTRKDSIPATSAPESLGQQTTIFSEKSDVFMFGCTLWEMFTRTKPFYWLEHDILKERCEFNVNGYATVKSFFSKLHDEDGRNGDEDGGDVTCGSYPMPNYILNQESTKSIK